MVETDLERAEERAEAGEGYVVTWFLVTLWQMIFCRFLFGFIFCVLSLLCQRILKCIILICNNRIILLNEVRLCWRAASRGGKGASAEKRIHYPVKECSNYFFVGGSTFSRSSFGAHVAQVWRNRYGKKYFFQRCVFSKTGEYSQWYMVVMDVCVCEDRDGSFHLDLCWLEREYNWLSEKRFWWPLMKVVILWFEEIIIIYHGLACF